MVAISMNVELFAICLAKKKKINIIVAYRVKTLTCRDKFDDRIHMKLKS